jgi:hypothetical protein
MRHARNPHPSVQEKPVTIEKIGFVWNPLDAPWEEGFGYLKSFQKRESHCRVPRGHKENNFPLGQWISVQRANKNKMSADRRSRLDDIGFVWNALQSDWKKDFVGYRNMRIAKDIAVFRNAIQKVTFRLVNGRPSSEQTRVKCR